MKFNPLEPTCIFKRRRQIICALQKKCVVCCTELADYKLCLVALTKEMQGDPMNMDLMLHVVYRGGIVCQQSIEVINTKLFIVEL